MALKVEVDSLDGIEEAHQPLYVKGDDGRFRLDIEGLPDISGLKNALNDEREQRKTLSSQLKRFDGVDLEYYGQVAKQKDLFDKFVKTGGVDEDAINSTVEQRVGRMKDEHARELAIVNDRYTMVNSRLEKVLVDNAISATALSKGVNDTAVEDVLRRARDVFRVVDGDVKPIDGKGETIYGKDGIKPLTQAEWLDDLRESAPHLFKPSKGGGASPSDGNRGGGGSAVRYKEDLVSSLDKSKFIEQHGMEKYLDLPRRPKQAGAA